MAQVVFLWGGTHPRSVPVATVGVGLSFVVFSQWIAWTQSIIVGAWSSQLCFVVCGSWHAPNCHRRLFWLCPLRQLLPAALGRAPQMCIHIASPPHPGWAVLPPFPGRLPQQKCFSPGWQSPWQRGSCPSPIVGIGRPTPVILLWVPPLWARCQVKSMWGWWPPEGLPSQSPWDTWHQYPLHILLWQWSDSDGMVGQLPPPCPPGQAQLPGRGCA